VKTARTTRARARLRRRQAKLDSMIARAKREIKTLDKRLRGKKRILSKRLVRRARMK